MPATSMSLLTNLNQSLRQIADNIECLPRKIWLLLAVIAFSSWAGVFIYKSSLVAIDGNRYFCLFDDAMISMRYAWNWAHGNGLVYNKGQYIEGITNFLMTAYMTVGTAIFDKSTAVLFVQVSGIIFMVIIAFVTMKLSDEVCSRTRLSGYQNLIGSLAFVAALAYFPLDYWALMGMETALLTVFILSATLFVLRTEGQAKPILIIPIFLGLAFWTRPDALIATALLFVYRWFSIVKQTRWRKTVIVEGTILGCFVILLTLFRIAYYGSAVPNTYTLKMTGLSLGFRLVDGWNFTFRFLREIAYPGGIIVLFVLFRPHKPLFLLLTLFIASIGYQIYIGGEPWTYWRMISPFMPLFFVLVLQCLGFLALENKQPSPRYLEKILLTLLWAGILVIVNERYYSQIIFREPAYQVLINRGNVNTAIALNAITKSGASAALLHAGTVPYYTDLEAIDILGKSDPYIAALPPDTSGASGWNSIRSMPGHNKHDLNYSIVKQQPTFTETLKFGRQDISKLAANYKVYSFQTVTLLLNSDSKLIKWEKVTESTQRTPNVPLIKKEPETE